MKDIHKILVCVDLSDYSKDTIEYAITFQKGFKAEVLLLNIINRRDIDALNTAEYYYPGRIDIVEYVGRVRDDRAKRLEELAQDYSGETSGKIQVRVGNGVPFEEILKIVEEENFDIVIMGNKGRSNLASTLFGSTAEKVFKYAKVPVVSVRNRIPAEKA